MANKIIHTKHLGDNRYRHLSVYYEKGGMNHWIGRLKSKGVYFASICYKKSEDGSSRTYIIERGASQKGEGYMLVTPLETYRPTVLKLVEGRVGEHADLIHDLLEQGRITDLEALLCDGTLPEPKSQAA